MANRYWVGGTASWDGTAGTKWATTSGGAGGSAVPTASDDVFFDAASGAVTVTQSGARVCLSLNMTGFTGTFAGSGGLTVGGSVTLAGTYTSAGVITFNGSGNLTSNGKTIAGGITINGAGITVTMQDAAIGNSTNSTLTLTQGTLDQNGFDASFVNFASAGSSTRVLTQGGGTIVLHGTVSSISVAGSNQSFTTPPNFKFTSGNSGNKNVTSNVALGDIWVSADGVLTITGATTVDDIRIDRTASGLQGLAVNGGITLTANSFNMDGAAVGNMTFIRGQTGEGTISVASGTITFNHVAISDMNFSGGATFVANNSIDIDNNTGITINAPSGGGGAAQLVSSGALVG